MMKLNMRKTVAVLAAVATLGVAGPVAASAADAPVYSTPCSYTAGDTADLYTVKFCTEDGWLIGAVGWPKTAPKQFSMYADGQDANVQVPAGQKFVGWKTRNGSEPVKADAVVYSDMTVYPVYKATEFTVVFYDQNDEKLDEVALPAGTAFSEFAKQAEAKLQVPQGKKLAGWYVAGSDQLIDGNEPINANGWNVYPKFEPAVSNVTVVFYDQNDEKLDEVALPAGTAFSEFAKQAEAKLQVPQGKKLAGWYFAGAEDKTIDPAEAVNADGWNVYPVFVDADPVPVQNVTVTFVGQDGTTITSISKPAGSPLSAFSADVTAPVVDGQEFVGWSWDSFTETIDPSTAIGQNATVYTVYRDAPNQPVRPGWPGWWNGWWNGWHHWFGGWFHGFAGWWR